VADFNGDGVPDYAGIGGTPWNPVQVEIWYGSMAGLFSKRQTYSISGVYAWATDLKTGDLNHDAISDLVLSGELNSTNYAGPLTIFLGKGDGTFTSPISLTQRPPVGTVSGGPQLLDFNADGFLDILGLCWTSRTLPTLSALMISLSPGINPAPSAGALLTIQNLNPGASTRSSLKARQI